MSVTAWLVMALVGLLNPPLLDEAAVGIARGESIVRLSKRLGIGRRTLTRWKCREDFRQRVAELRAEAVGRAMGQAAAAAGQGAAALKRLLKSKNEGIVLGAARSLLQLSGSLYATVQLQAEIESIQRKIADLEAAGSGVEA